MPPEWNKFEAASRGLVDALFEQREPRREDLEVVRSVLTADMRRLGFDPQIAEDIASEAILRLLSAIRFGRVDRAKNVPGFIRRTARYCALDAVRRQVRRPLIAEGVELPDPRSDDDVAAILDAVVSADDVTAALALAAEEGELELAAFVSQWLQVAERVGEEPSLRDAAEELGTSHMHVKRQLDRFRTYLQRVRRP